MAIHLNTRLVPIPGITPLAGASPLGLLAPLSGKWTGAGFNQIFRPLNGGGGDNFLELNLTQETLEFTEIPGEIPNRGFVQGDISLFGLTYLQQVADANVKDTNGNPAGIHIEPGIWINIPATTDPAEQSTVARLANIPHGTSLVAQGTAVAVPGGPVFEPVDITPFEIGNPAVKFPFPSQVLANPSPGVRSPDTDIVGVTQAMLDNPNSVLADALVGKTINSTTVIQITTLSGPGQVPDSGGGVSDIAFLDGSGGNPNAHVAQMVATFWISDFTDATGSGTLLQYSQIVLLNFNGLSWPHVSVANLKAQVVKSLVKDLKDHKAEIKDKTEVKVELKDHKPEVKDKFEVKVELKDHKIEVKEIEVPFPPFPPIPPEPPVSGLAGPAAPSSGQGQHFIQPNERPAVGDPATQAEDPGRAGPASPAEGGDAES